MRGILGRFARVTPKSNVKVGSINDDLRGGATYRLPTIDQVAEQCPFINETLANGGSNLDNEPQWHDMAALACHCVDPSATIHRLCEKNQYYDRDDTEKKLKQAQQYRDQNSALGPPKCVTLQDNGAPHCVTCPHLAKDTTPIALPFQVNGYPSLNDDLPPGYFRDDKDCICVEEKDTKNGKSERIPVFPYPIYLHSGRLEGNPLHLIFTTLIGGEKSLVSFDTKVFASDKEFHATCLSIGGLGIPGNVTKARRFGVHYIKLLQSKKETIIRMPPLGWHQQDDKIWGFAYDGEFITPQGKRPVKFVSNYRVVGNTKVWRDMAQMVLTKNRPDLMVLVASAFAAPLVQMSGQNGFLIGTHSAASGIGKTTALMLANAVWTHPALGGFSDTVNYTFDKCAILQNLPVIYDEIKGEYVGNFVNIVFGMTSGREKGRTDRSGHMRETRTWHTLITYATNESIVDAVADQTRGTHASAYRIFEFEALNLPYTNLTSMMANLTTQLGFNYGGIGKIYAEYLGQHHDDIQDKLLKFQIKLEQELSAQSAERCQIAAMSTALFGAALANQLELTTFDIPLMKKFMAKEFRRMQNNQKFSDGDYTNPDAIYNELSILMNESTQNTIVTDRVWASVGKPPVNYARIIRHPTQELGIQISGDPLTIRIRESFFGEWCIKHKRQRSSLLKAIIEVTGAQRNRVRLASGTGMAGTSEWTIIILITGTPLAQLNEYIEQFKDLKP
jgi:hypothetical protein